MADRWRVAGSPDFGMLLRHYRLAAEVYQEAPAAIARPAFNCATPASRPRACQGWGNRPNETSRSRSRGLRGQPGVRLKLARDMNAEAGMSEEQAINEALVADS